MRRDVKPTHSCHTQQHIIEASSFSTLFSDESQVSDIKCSRNCWNGWRFYGSMAEKCGFSDKSPTLNTEQQRDWLQEQKVHTNTHTHTKPMEIQNKCAPSNGNIGKQKKQTQTPTILIRDQMKKQMLEQFMRNCVCVLEINCMLRLGLIRKCARARAPLNSNIVPLVVVGVYFGYFFLFSTSKC